MACVFGEMRTLKTELAVAVVVVVVEPKRCPVLGKTRK